MEKTLSTFLFLFYFSNFVHADIILIPVNDYDTSGYHVFRYDNYYKDELRFSNGASLSIRSVNNGITGPGNTSYIFLAFLNDDTANSDVAYKHHDSLKKELFEFPDPYPEIYFTLTRNNPDIHFSSVSHYPSDLFDSDYACYYDYETSTNYVYTAVPLFERGYTDINWPHFCYTYEGSNSIVYVKKGDTSDNVTHIKIQMKHIQIETDTNTNDPYVETMSLVWAVDGDGDGIFTDDMVESQKKEFSSPDPVLFRYLPPKKLFIISPAVAKEGYSISIYNHRGQNIFTFPFRNSPILKIPNLCTGNYIFRFKSNNCIKMGNVVVLE